MGQTYSLSGPVVSGYLDFHNKPTSLGVIVDGVPSQEVRFTDAKEVPPGWLSPELRSWIIQAFADKLMYGVEYKGHMGPGKMYPNGRSALCFLVKPGEDGDVRDVFCRVINSLATAAGQRATTVRGTSDKAMQQTIAQAVTRLLPKPESVQ